MLKYAKNTLGYNRYGFVVSKKIDTRATARNRVKRIVRSCFEELQEQTTQGYDMLIVIKKEAVKKERSEVFNTVKECLGNCNLLN